MKMQKDIEQERLKEVAKLLKAIRYPTPALSPAIDLDKKLKQFQKKAFIKDLQHKFRDFNCYRQVRGDGNCFLRAVAFVYMSRVHSATLQKNFQHLGKVSLTMCDIESIPPEFKPFYNDDLLKSVLRQYWETEYKFFLRITEQNPRRCLARLYTQNPFFDWIVILYLRSLCLWGLQRYGNEHKDFLQGTEEKEIKTYGEESEGAVLKILSQVLNINILIHEIRSDKVIEYEYSRTSNHNSVNLLYFEGHYDLVHYDMYYREEKADKKEEDYFDFQQTLAKGCCLECQKEGEIIAETALCKECTEKGLEILGTYKKDTFAQGYCEQCKMTRSKVSEFYHLCKSCIEMQDAVSEYIQKTKPEEKGKTDEKNMAKYKKNQDKQDHQEDLQFQKNLITGQKTIKNNNFLYQKERTAKKEATDRSIREKKQKQAQKKDEVLYKNCIRCEQKFIPTADRCYRCESCTLISEKLSKELNSKPVSKTILLSPNFASPSVATNQCKKCLSDYRFKDLYQGVCASCIRIQKERKDYNYCMMCKEKQLKLINGLCGVCRANKR